MKKNQAVRTTEKKRSLSSVLRKSWFRLRLSVRNPSRVPTWDAIVLTAASPEQAQLFEWQLARAKRIGRIAADTVTLAVPDPNGARIGSGAATIHALASLSKHLLRIGVHSEEKVQIPSVQEKDSAFSNSNDFCPLSFVNILGKKHILLLHAGGDSKRVPWANPMGKVFLPLPYLASDNPDGPVPLLFDHILAISSCARQAFHNEGGIFIMTGDVLPCFDASTLTLPDDAACIITVPITLDIASNHGVIVASRIGNPDESCSFNKVQNLLQKPNLKQLIENNAIGLDGRALLDTGMIAVRGKAWIQLLKLTVTSKIMISELLETRKEMSLYEDLVAAWVPAKHEWLKQRPFGKELVGGLGSENMFSFCADNLLFLHFGTSVEVLDHLGDTDSSLVGRRHMCSLPETIGCDLAASAVILSSKILSGVSVGEDSLVYDSSLSGRVQIGSQSIVVGVNISQSSENSVRYVLPDRHCLWEVPLVGCTRKILIFCGLHDNPKISFAKNGTFCGKPWKLIMHNLGIEETDLWDISIKQDKCMWNAKIFPVCPSHEMLILSMWLMGSIKPGNDFAHSTWRSSQRVSLEELHRSICFSQLCIDSSDHQADLAIGITRACINYGSLGRNLDQLSKEILQMTNKEGIKVCKEFLSYCSNFHVQNPLVVAQSRIYQVHVDLLRACGDEEAACSIEQKVWAAVATETDEAVKYKLREHSVSSTRITSEYLESIGNEAINVGFQSQKIRIDLPVRIDFVGGWSDTPPWSLERPGCVLNMAINLEGIPPISSVIETKNTRGILICDDSNNELYIEDPMSIKGPFEEDDPFRLVKSTLLVTGISRDKLLLRTGLYIKTFANVPRGSGLGTSSILAAAVVRGLLRLMRQDDGNENVARVVLAVEQVMGTGGGWQDQIGGLYPGIKCTMSFPGQPLRLQVEPVLASSELIRKLDQRLVIVFTGQVRLAHQVLQMVVTRYLRRDNLLISSIKRLAALAKIGREALMNGDVDDLGNIMLEAWRLHQELDPYCSNEYVDRLFKFADRYCCGYKLVGAGGGGFALLLAKDCDSAIKLKQVLGTSSEFNVKIYNWCLFLK